MKEKTDEELFKELYDSCEAEPIELFDANGFIEYCENLYKMTSKEFKKHFEKNEYEGNVDFQMWYQIIKNEE